MPPVIGVDDEAFDGFTDECRIGGDQISLPRRRHEASAKAGAERHRYQSDVSGAADPTVNQKGLHVDVVLLRAVLAEKLERTDAVRTFENDAEREPLLPEAAARTDIVGLDRLGAFEKHV